MSAKHVPDLDPGRSSWVLLSIEVRGQPEKPDQVGQAITSWDLGVGNPENIVLSASYNDAESDDHPVSALGSELATYQDEDSLLITPSSRTLQILRSNLYRRHRAIESTTEKRVINAKPRPTLHGYRHLPIKDTLDEYFPNSNSILSGQSDDQHLEQTEAPIDEIHPNDMWSIARTVIPLLPIDVGFGRHL